MTLIKIPDRTKLPPTRRHARNVREFSRFAGTGKYVEVWIQVADIEARSLHDETPIMIRGKRPDRWHDAELFWSGRVPEGGRIPKPTRADLIAIGVAYGARKAKFEIRTDFSGAHNSRGRG